jgi:hypothetical protein
MQTGDYKGYAYFVRKPDGTLFYPINNLIIDIPTTEIDSNYPVNYAFYAANSPEQCPYYDDYPNPFDEEYPYVLAEVTLHGPTAIIQIPYTNMVLRHGYKITIGELRSPKPLEQGAPPPAPPI